MIISMYIYGKNLVQTIRTRTDFRDEFSSLKILFQCFSVKKLLLGRSVYERSIPDPIYIYVIF